MPVIPLKNNKMGVLLAFFCFLFGQAIQANPEIGSVVVGQVTISHSPNQVTINQASNHAVINWDSFNIAAHETTQFVQPVNGATLNRINSVNGASEILGNLNSNGTIMLINPAGVIFGKSANVNVGGIIAATGDITNENFMSNQFIFEHIPQNSKIINEGIIKTDNGLVGLIGGVVQNSGYIGAKLSKVALASGTQVTIDLNGDDLICFSIDQDVADAAQAHTEVMTQTGIIEAPGGYVVVAVSTAEGVLDQTLNMSGVIEANSVENRNGKIVLFNKNSKVVVDGDLKANSCSIGGEVQILGADLKLNANTNIEAVGVNGGGKVLIGGDYKGQNPDVHNASKVIVNKDATINADAFENGNGGTVIVWSEDFTQFNGGITARGGTRGGDGGFVEVSSKNNLIYDPFTITDTIAPAGNTGTLLLDPAFLVVATAGGVSYSDGINNLFNNNVSGTNTLTPASIVTAAAGANITLQANTDVTFTNALAITTAARTLTVRAGRSILQNANVSTTNGAILFSANDTAATSADRQAGNGAITMTAASTLSSGTAALTLLVGPSSTVPFSPGNITALGLTGGAISITTPNAMTATTIAASTSVSVDVGGTSAINGIISGTGATLTKLGGGLLNLAAANTYTGATNVNLGTLRASNAAAFGSTTGGVTVANGASIEINGVAIGAEAFIINGTGVGGAGAIIGTGTASHSGTVALGSDSTLGGTGTLTLSGIVSGAFNLTKTGTGTLILANANTYSGNTIINQGTCTASNATALGPVASGTVTVTSGATLNLNAAIVGTKPFVLSGTGVGGIGALIGTGTSSHAGTITLLADTTIGGTGNTLTQTGIISGAFNVTKVGTGTLNLNGANTYSGTTLVSAGTLGVGNATGLGSNATNLTVASGASFSIGAVAIGAKPMSIAGTGVGGNGALLGAGTGSYAGAITMTDNTSFGGTGNATTLSGVISGAFNITKAGTGAFVLSNASNNFNGNLIINAGAIRVATDGNLGAVPGAVSIARITLGGGTLQATAAFTINSNRGITLTSSTTSTLQSDVSTLTYNGIIAGSGNLIKSGTGITALGGNNTFNGTLAINAGILSLTAVNAIQNVSAVSLANIAGAGLQLNSTQTISNLSGGGATGGTISLGAGTLTINQTTAGTYAGAISGTGNLTLGASSTNTLTLSSTTSTYSGVTAINGGAISVSADSNLGTAPGTVTPADIVINNGTLIATSSFTLNSNRGITLSGDSNIQVQPGMTLTYNGVITGSFALTKLNSGVLSLNALQTYTGATNINAGTLLLNSANLLLNSSSIVFANASGVTLDCNGFAQTINNLSGGGVSGGLIALGIGSLTINQTTDTTYGGELQGSGNITLSSSSTNELALTNSSSGLTGTWNINGGTLSISSDNTLGAVPGSATAAKINFNGGVLRTNADLTISSNRGIAILGGGGTFQVDPNTTTIYGGIIDGIIGSGALTKSGTGDLNLGGVNTYNGATVISSGKLSLTNAGALGATTGTVVSANAQLDLNFNSATLINTNTITLNGVGVASSGALTFSGSFVTINNPIAVASSSAIGGIGSGVVTLGGTLAVTNPLSISLANASLVLPNVNMAAAFSASAANSITQTGVFTGSLGAVASFGGSTANTDIILDKANNFGSTTAFTGTLSNIRDVYFRDVGLAAALPDFTGLNSLRNLTILLDNSSLQLPEITLTNAGALSATAGGAITQSGILNVPSTASFTAGANQITLGLNNNLIGTVTLSNVGSNDVAITNNTNLIFATSTVGRNLSATANGTITQTGILTVPGTASFTAGANDINLNSNNVITGAISLSNSGANNATLKNSNATVLGTVNIGQDFAVTSGGSVSQAGVISIPNASFTIAVTAANSDVTLNSANDLGSVAPVFTGTRSNFRDVYLRNINNDAQSPTFSTFSNLRNLTLEFNNSAMVLPMITLHSGGNFIAIAGGAVTQSGPLTIPGTTSVSAGANTISLSQINQLHGEVTLANSGANNVSVTNGTNLIFAVSTVGHDLTVTSSGSVTQTGILTVPGKSAFNSGTNPITLTSNNLFTGSISCSNSGAHDITIKNTLATVIGSVAAGRNVALSSGGTISQSEPIVATGGVLDLAVSSPNSSILLPESNDFGSFAPTFSGTTSFITNINLKNISAFAATPSFTGMTNLHYVELTFPNQTVSLSNLDMHGTAVFYSNNVTGSLNVHGLQLETNFCNLTGFINGLAGDEAIEQIVLLNTISQGTHFFDGIDMYGVSPTPPTPAVSNITGTIDTLVKNVLYIGNSFWNDIRVGGILLDYYKMLDENVISSSDANSCISYGSALTLCY